DVHPVPAVALLPDGEHLVRVTYLCAARGFGGGNVVLGQVELRTVRIAEVAFPGHGRTAHRARQFGAHHIPVPDAVDAVRGVTGGTGIVVPATRVREFTGVVDVVGHRIESQHRPDLRIPGRLHLGVAQPAAEHLLEEALF